MALTYTHYEDISMFPMEPPEWALDVTNLVDGLKPSFVHALGESKRLAKCTQLQVQMLLTVTLTIEHGQQGVQLLSTKFDQCS